MSNMVVRTNIYALNSHRNMKNVGLQQKQASNRLSSGYRVNSAADDAAGLAISENMRAQIRGLDQASRNAQDGQAMILTTEGGLEEIGNMLQRTRELLVQASNDTNTQGQRDMIQQEIQQLGEEIAGMQQRVEFNTNQVLNMGTPADISKAQVAFAKARAALQTSVASSDIKKASALVVDGSAASKGTSATTKQNSADARLELAKNTEAAIASLTAGSAIKAKAASAASLYASAAKLASTAAILKGSTMSIEAKAESMRASAQIMLDKGLDTFAGEEGTMRAEIIAGTPSTGDFKAWFQVGANSKQGIEFDFATVHAAVTVAARLVSHIGENIVAPGTNGKSGIGFGGDVSSMLSSVQGALDNLNNVRANLGAVQNRMDYTMRSLDISSENLSDSESRVRNADMAKEMMKFTMSNVLQQAAVSMLSQANQMPNNLLQLLR